MSHGIELNDIKKLFIFTTSKELSSDLKNKIVFTLSAQNLNSENILWVKDIPILFPMNNNQDLYSIDQNNNLIFHHDLLKSAFYLLSGYQELNPEYKDRFGRFPYELSIQKKLGIIKKPVVNYYFDFIIKGLEEFCKIHNLELKRKKPFSPFAFFLSHDVDKIDTYNIYDVIYYMKVLFGLAKKEIPFSRKIQKVAEYLFHYLFTRKNPNWDFDFLRNLEKKFDFTSTFYFLPKDLKHQDAYYSFHEKRVHDLFNQLKAENCEIGIHGTNRSATRLKFLQSNIAELEKASGVTVSGIRQHRLIFDMSITPYIHEEAGLAYDTSLAFAEHEGFRNSYCFPFKLYNFKEDRPFKTWEIPLNVMDATLFEYRNLGMDDAFESVREILKEVIKFNGVFSLLWHNGFFDEILNPGIKNFYISLLKIINSKNGASIFGKNII
ncbi:MAG TPA: polysaccharide deacetylase family protein [Halanaerobiales bacterium]|nr:polysaccharide deacetylase family protein [Halanaerobiales bacterium]